MGATYPNYDSSGGSSNGVSFASGVIPIGAAIHTTAGTNSLDYLQRGSEAAGRPASADYLIDRDGKRHKICKEGRRPYHIGQSVYTLAGRRRTGDEISALLLGVELEQTGEQLVTWQQLDSLAELIVERGFHYGWRWPYVILGHYELATPLGRRSDPQGFDWGAFMGFLYVRASASDVPGL